jgi:hypothetical protein
LQGFFNRYDADILPILVDQTDLGGADILVSSYL